jgi:hypothetical protein
MFTFCSLSMTTYRVHLVSYLILGKKMRFWGKENFEKMSLFSSLFNVCARFLSLSFLLIRVNNRPPAMATLRRTRCAVGVFLFLCTPSFFLRARKDV